MSDLPENLQVIKQEQISPSTPTEASLCHNNNIKVKLNLHVKRRLQQDYNQNKDEEAETNPTSGRNNNMQSAAEYNRSKQNIDVPNEKMIRQKRPYHKRTDKVKNSATSTEAPNQQVRKYKHKLKQLVINTAVNPDVSTPAPVEDNGPNSSNVGTTSAGDDENEIRLGREKDKCPDVLAMVLSMKKRALLQDPEVQSFLVEVMKVMKD